MALKPPERTVAPRRTGTAVPAERSRGHTRANTLRRRAARRTAATCSSGGHRQVSRWRGTDGATSGPERPLNGKTSVTNGHALSNRRKN